MIDLSSNENPYQVSKKVGNAVISSVEYLNRYLGYEDISRLKEAIAAYAVVEKNSILVASSTNYLFEKVIIGMAKGRDVFVFNPTLFHSVEIVPDVGGRIVRLQLTPPDFIIDWSSVGSIPSLVFIDNPNHPTGKCLIDREQLKVLLENENNLVVIDEAGFEYSGNSFVDFITLYPNLAITRTLDKAFGLAGMKVSWLVGGKAFSKILASREVLINRPAYLAALAALEDSAYMLENVRKTVCERNRLEMGLKKLGFDVFPSEANYLLIRTEIPDFVLRLKQVGFLIYDLSPFWLAGFCIVSVGNEEENEALLQVIEKIFCEK